MTSLLVSGEKMEDGGAWGACSGRGVDTGFTWANFDSAVPSSPEYVFPRLHSNQAQPWAGCGAGMSACLPIPAQSLDCTLKMILNVDFHYSLSSILCFMGLSVPEQNNHIHIPYNIISH